MGRITALIGQRDPDVIEGHELFRVILPALTAHGKKAKKNLGWGRDGSPPESRPSRLQVAEKTINYPKFEIHGRHLVDTALLAQFYDVSARELESYDLDDIVRHFHIKEESVVRQTRALAALLSGSYFIQAGIFPYNYQDVVVRGNAMKIDALLLWSIITGRATRFPICRRRGRSRGIHGHFFSPASRGTCGTATSPRSIPR